jgi:hypothetical protein
MSTRCHIRFDRLRSWEEQETGEEKTETNRVQVYKHSDGYPSNVVPMIRRFHDKARRRKGDVEYYSAAFVYYMKRLQERRVRESSHYDAARLPDEAVDSSGGGDGFEPPLRDVLRGHGICPEPHLHGDAEHYYVVDLNTTIVRHYNDLSELQGGDSKVKLVDRMAMAEPANKYGMNLKPEAGL